MKTNEIICTCAPNYAETLRKIPVGAKRTYMLTGRAYTAFMTARSRLQARKEGTYEFDIDKEANTVTITRES